MSQPESSNPLPRFRRRWIPVSIGAVGVALAACVTLIALYPDTDWAISEYGPIETWHITTWICSVIISAIALAKWRDRTTRLMDFWLLMVACAAAARELDLHLLLRPGSALGDFGMRYRIDWWMSAEHPLWLKLAWFMINIALLASFALPPLLVRAPGVRLLRAGDGASWTFVFALVFLGIGYASDDLVGRGQFIEPLHSRWIEETSEGLGALLFMISAAISLMCPLSARIAHVMGQAPAVNAASRPVAR